MRMFVLPREALDELRRGQRYLSTASLAVPAVLAACGSPPADSGGQSEAEASGGVIGEDYVDALDKAETVDDVARERKDRLGEAVDGSG
jgi:hypothetical protein